MKMGEKIPAVEFRDVWERYLIKFIRNGRATIEEMWSLKGINFKVDQGDGLAIIGENGAGKTTILKLVAGILRPDKGRIAINGRVSGLLDLGAGFQQELTGRQNIYLNAALFGLKRKEIDERFDKILEFSGIGRFIDATCNSLSQGMFVRLAFSLAIHIDPDIIVIDDTLAVGDAEYQKKCIKKIFELREQNKAIILVTHDLTTAGRLCERGIFLKEGRIIQDTSFKKVAASYMQAVGAKKGVSLIKDGPLTVIFNNGKLGLNWNGIPLTKHLGGYVSSITDGRQHFSNEYLWRIEKEGPERIVARGEHLAIPVYQNWEIEYKRPNQISWKVELLSKGPVYIEEEMFSLILAEEFNRWIDLESEDLFTDDFLPGANWHSIFPARYKCQGFFGIIGEKVGNESVPCISVMSPSEDSNISVFNSGQDIRGRIIQLRGASFADNPLSSSARKILSGKITLFDSEEDLRKNIAAKREEATIKNGPLKLTMCNNKIKMFFNDTEITGHPGMHASFLAKERWYHSQEAIVNIKEKNEKDAVLELRWPLGNIRQLWRMSISDNMEMILKIDTCSDSRIMSDNKKIRIALNKAYSSWFGLADSGDFIHDPAWIGVRVKDPENSVIGSRNEGPGKNPLPEILFEVADKSKETMREMNQEMAPTKDIRFSNNILEVEDKSTFYFDSKSSSFFSTRIKIIQNSSEIDALVETDRHKRQGLIKKEFAEYTQDRTIEIEREDIKLVLAKPSLAIYYKGKLLSRNNFLDTSYVCENKERKTEFEGLKIEILQQSRHGLKVLLYKWNIPIRQIWTISLDKKGCIDWHIELLLKQRTSITNKQIILNMNDIFSDWFTEFESGRFKERSLAKEITPVHFTRPNAHVIGMESKGIAASPVVTLVCPDEKDYIVDYSRGRSQIALKALEINDSKNITYDKGQHDFFKGKIYISGKKYLRGSYDKRNKNNTITIKDGQMRLEFFQGTGRLYFKDKELTTGLGLYSTVFNNNRWLDSSQATWKIYEKGRSNFIAEGFWAWIPLSQLWHLQIDKGGNILWDIESETYDEVKVDLEQISLMLEKGYSKWAIPEVITGVFPEDFGRSNLDNYWERLYYGQAENSVVTIENNDNRVIYRPLIADEDVKIVIENSDDLYKGRVVQCMRPSTGKRQDMRVMINVEEI